jgi:hypothetical protein
MVSQRLVRRYPNGTRPELRSLHQMHGRVEFVGLFPNPALERLAHREAVEPAERAEDEAAAEETASQVEGQRKTEEAASEASDIRKAKEVGNQIEVPPGAEVNQARSEVFVNYSHRDERRLRQLRAFLSPLIRNKTIVVWDDTKINPGSKWQASISAALERAKVALLLISPDFLDSDFINRDELPRLLAAAEIEGLTIIWIPLRPSLVAFTPIIEFQAAISPTRPLNAMRAAERETAFVRIAEAIAAAVGAATPTAKA